MASLSDQETNLETFITNDLVVVCFVLNLHFKLKLQQLRIV